MKFNINNIKQPFVVLLIGPPLSGKSTFLKQISNSNIPFKIISRDDILMEIYEDMGHTDNDYSKAFKVVNQKKVDFYLINDMKDCNKNNTNVFIDMTNMTSKRRKTTLSYFDDDYNKYAIVFPILSEQEYKIRNEKRLKESNKFIGHHIINNMIKSFQPVSHDEGIKRVFEF